MILKKGDMFYNWDKELLIVTTNSYITNVGRLVMGRGAALQLKKKFPNVDRMFGTRIKNICGHLGQYGVLTDFVDYKKIGIFQVKCHFKADASMNLIKNSLNSLEGLISNDPKTKIRMNFPGIGYGGLYNERSKILKMLKKLPDNVTIWEYD